MPMCITDSLSIALLGLQQLFRETTKSSLSMKPHYTKQHLSEKHWEKPHKWSEMSESLLARRPVVPFAQPMVALWKIPVI